MNYAFRVQRSELEYLQIMDSKDNVLLTLIGELHEYCKANGLLYYLSETETTAYSVTLIMDPDNIKKFLQSFKCPSEDRGLEWAGNNHAIVGEKIKYADLNTFYYTKDRLLRELYLGMFVTISPAKPNKSKLAKLDRVHRYTGIAKSDGRSALLNSAAAKTYYTRINKAGGKLKKADIIEVVIGDTPVYVRKKSAFVKDPDAAWDKHIVRKPNSNEFMCDESFSYKDLNLENDRKTLADYERKIVLPRRKLKKGEALRKLCATVSTASYCRFCVATDLLMKYSYDEILEHGAEKGEIKKALDTYIERANKLREKECSGYVGDEFTKVINKLYPKVDTTDLYKFTPDLYKSGIHVYDQKGELIGTYGGSNEH